MTSPLQIGPDTRIVVLTGAGISVSSGLRTYRGDAGLYDSDELARFATAAGFFAEPEEAWRRYREWRRLISSCSPSPAHLALSRFEERHSGSLTVVTQNVDGLHQRAGSRSVIEVHGTLFSTRCSDLRCTSKPFIESLDTPLAELGSCVSCGSLLRPDVVWFGEMLDPAQSARIDLLLDECDLFVAIGTSGLVYPAAGYARRARRTGARSILVNLDPVENISSFDDTFFGSADELVPFLFGLGDLA